MRLSHIVLGGMCLFTTVAMAGPASKSLKSEQDRLSYTIGADLGNNFKQQGIKIDANLMARGFRDVQSNKKTALTKKEMETTLKTFHETLLKKRAKRFKDLSVKNKEAGQKFLTENKAKPGITALDNGLQYKVVSAGKGSKPKSTDAVKVEYTGTLINGQVFDSTDKTGKPITFKLNQVIKGWGQALQLMNEGSTWEVFIPSELAYGAQGAGGVIGPNETLIFKIHLISIEKNS